MFKLLSVVVFAGILFIASPFAYHRYVEWEASQVPPREESWLGKILRNVTPRIVASDIVQSYEFNLRVPVVDVRSREEYEAVHIFGAISIPQEELQSTIEKKVPISAERVFVYGEDDNQGAIAVRLLRQMGYAAYYLEGGFKYWVKQGYKVEKSNSMYF